MLPAFASIHQYYHGPQEMKHLVSAWYLSAGLITQRILRTKGHLPFGGLKDSPGYDTSALLSGISILDLCSGPGDFLNHISTVLPHVQGVCVDRLDVFTKAGRKQFPRFEHHNGDAVTIDLGRTFDAVVISSGYHHVPDDRKADLLRNARRHLNDTGVIVIVDSFLPSYNDQTQREKAVYTFYDIAKRDLLAGLGSQASMRSFEHCRQSDLVQDDESKVSYAIFVDHVKEADLRIDVSIPVWQPKEFIDDNAGTFVLLLTR